MPRCSFSLPFSGRAPFVRAICVAELQLHQRWLHEKHSQVRVVVGLVRGTHTASPLGVPVSPPGGIRQLWPLTAGGGRLGRVQHEP